MTPGADPIVVLSDLGRIRQFCHPWKIVPATADNVAFGETERVRARDRVKTLDAGLSRMWQMLLKGHHECRPRRGRRRRRKWCWCGIAYVADMPTAGRSDQMPRAEWRCIAGRPRRAAAPSASRARSPFRRWQSAAAPWDRHPGTRQRRAVARPQMNRRRCRRRSPRPHSRIASFPDLVGACRRKTHLLTKAGPRIRCPRWSASKTGGLSWR